MKVQESVGKISRKAWKLALTLVFMPLVSGCIETVDSNQVSEDSIYQTYRLNYSEETRQLVASAAFNVGGPWGTTVRLQAPSRVLLNDLQLSERSFLGTTYEGRWTAPFSMGPHRWTWIDQQGDGHIHSISIVPFQVENPPRSVSLSASLIITMTGQALSSEDSWGVWITQFKPDGSIRFESLQTQVLDSRHLRVEFWNDTQIFDGEAQLSIRRTRSAGLQEVPARSGTLYGTYEATPIPVQITR